MKGVGNLGGEGVGNLMDEGGWQPRGLGIEGWGDW